MYIGKSQVLVDLGLAKVFYWSSQR